MNVIVIFMCWALYSGSFTNIISVFLVNLEDSCSTLQVKKEIQWVWPKDTQIIRVLLRSSVEWGLRSNILIYVYPRFYQKHLGMACVVAGIPLSYMYVSLYFQGKTAIVLLKIFYIGIGTCMIPAGSTSWKSTAKINVFWE